MRAAEIRLHERANGKITQRGWQMAATRADPAFPAKTTGPRARADRAFGYRTRAGIRQRGKEMLLAYMAPLDIIQKTIVALTDDRVDRARGNANRWVLLHSMLGQGIGDQPNVERIGQGNWCFEHAQFAHLFKTARLAKTVDRMHGGANFFLKEIARMRHNHGDASADRAVAGAQRSFAFDQRCVANAHPSHIGDRVVWPRRQHPVIQTQITRAGTFHYCSF